jgi:dimethylamine/trimethylamine dehydrogenase
MTWRWLKRVANLAGGWRASAGLPGLAAWGRVRDYREYQLKQRGNVEIYLESDLNADQVLEFGFEHVAIATGARWRRDGVARQHVVPMPIAADANVFTPDDLMDGSVPGGKVIVHDDDHYYMGGVMAELLATSGADVTLITTSAYVSDWTRNTLEQEAIHARLAGLGVNIVLNRGVSEIASGHVVSNCVYTGSQQNFDCDSVVMVVSQASDDALCVDLLARQAQWSDAGIRTVRAFGDAEAPGPIAWATYAGHRYARELDEPDIGDDLPFRREIAELAAGLSNGRQLANVRRCWPCVLTNRAYASWP